MKLEIVKSYNETVNAISHPIPHHGDEVYATAMLLLLFPHLVLFRTRNKEIIAAATNAIVYDVGGVYDPEKKRFDHHQKGFSEARPDGTIYASAGLVWREYGVEIVKKMGADASIAQEVVDKVDDVLIKGIDATDNGQAKCDGGMSVSAAISVFNPLWDADEDADECFITACEIAVKILRRVIESTISSVCGKKMVVDQIEATDGAVLVMDRFIGGWLEEIVNSDSPKAKGLLYAVFPAVDGNWNVQAIPPSKDEMTAQRKPFPKDWCGLRDQKLVEVSGIQTAVFCHLNAFFAVAETKQDAIALAEKAAQA